jgi:hypothetical protein
MRCAGILLLGVLLSGCGVPDDAPPNAIIPIIGTWSVQDPELTKNGMYSVIKFNTLTTYIMETVLTTNQGEEALITVLGQYKFEKATLTMTAESASVQAGSMSAESKKAYGEALDEAAIVANLNKNKAMNVIGVLSGKATVTTSDGRTFTMVRKEASGNN